jgi:predicted alpha-1,2-mannosidase
MEDDTRPVDPTPQVDLVNPFIGSGGRYWEAGSVYPGATVPFGMAKPGPDTTPKRTGGAELYHHYSGYHYDDEYITGFSQVHISGTGGADYGALLFMPTVGFDHDKTRESNYRSHFTKESEEATPGFYGVTLADHSIRVELTATERCAYHRYTYPSDTADGFVIVDLSHTIVDCEVSEAHLDIAPASSEISGWLHYHGALTGRSGGVKLYFSAVLDQEPTGWTVWRDGQLLPGEITAEGEDVGAAFKVTTDDPVEVRVGISYVDVAGARKNLLAELTDTDFDKVREEARQAWVKMLDLVAVEGGTKDERIKLYSGIYHAMLHPTLFSDSDGRYTGFDKQVHTAGDFHYYTDFSMWDTYRTVHPLYNLIIPARHRDMVTSLIKMYEEGGSLPKWPAGTGYTGGMIGTPADIVISEAYLKGITDFDVETAFAAMKEHATGPVADAERGGVEYYMSLGYVPADRESKASAKTQEFCIADAAIAALARELNKTQDAEDFGARSMNYKKLWDPNTQFIRGKNEDGSWAEPDEEFNPLDWAADYFAEGDAWQYTWLAPHDPAGLIELFGSPEAMTDKLEAFFATPEPDKGVPQEFLPRYYYWHGNEPDIHAAYLFSDAGRPDRTQVWVRNVLDTYYGTGADGLAGNDDLGTLSAWYVFSASGFYPVAGQVRYWIGSPVFERIVFSMGEGKIFEVRARNVSAENLYIQSARLNGSTLDNPWFSHTDISDGGELELTMGPEPSGWGR